MTLYAIVADARRDAGLSQSDFAKKLSVPRLSVVRLERGIGSMRLLLKAMGELRVRIANVARGASLPEQLQNRRRRLSWSASEAAMRAGIAPRTVAAVERGDGSIASACKLLSVIAPGARAEKAVRSSWSFDRSTLDERDTRFTPPPFLFEIVSAFGIIDIDPCGHIDAPISAKRKIIPPECGLSSQWLGRLAFVNPPFSAVVRWMNRAATAWENREVDRIIMLVPIRTDSPTYQNRVSRHADTLFLAGRLQFEGPNGPAWKAPFGLMLLLWGANDGEISKFIERVPAVRMRPWGDPAIFVSEASQSAG
jgi:transcriptional regulator with XRE-family HTH domain